MHKKN